MAGSLGSSENRGLGDWQRGRLPPVFENAQTLDVKAHSDIFPVRWMSHHAGDRVGGMVAALQDKSHFIPQNPNLTCSFAKRC